MIDPINIYFSIPATDHLGKNLVTGKVRFLETSVELTWRLAGSVFTGGKGEMKTIDIPYGEVESVEVEKGWFTIKKIILRIGNPKLVKEMPNIEMGKMCLVIDKRSKQEIPKLSSLIDFKKSEFILDQHEKRLKMLKESE